MCLNPIVAIYRKNAITDYQCKNKKKMQVLGNFRKLAREQGLTPIRAKAYFKDLINYYEINENCKVLLLPCRKCVECSKSRGLLWSARLVEESKKFNADSMCFLTLTYNDDNLPFSDKNGLPSLNHRDIQLFLKRLRKHFKDKNIKFYLAGEYGETTLRPHYHLILFGVGVPDLECVKIGANKNGATTFESSVINNLWYREDKNVSIGFNMVEELNDFSIMYVAGYVNKKYIKKFDFFAVPPYNVSSRGIGLDLLNRYITACKNNSFVTCKIGSVIYKLRNCGYLNNKFEEADVYGYNNIKNNRLHSLDIFDKYDLNSDLCLDEYLKNKESVLKDTLKQRTQV